ncbi:MAG: AraC family transcriptional regulator [Lachnospiraceae bacterium]|nr:AraC family transcriptional regulator [Lachnospiraceae bacterium]
MEWTECIKKTIACLEAHLLDVDEAYDVAADVGMSSFYLQKGFRIMTGYTMAEYVRNRRLYLAALEILTDKDKVIDIALKYGYDTPESFSKAFSRFHGVSPMQLRKDTSKLRVFLPLKIKIEVQGGNDMDYIVEKEKAFKVVGFEKEFFMDAAYTEIPKFWDEFCARYMAKLMRTGKPEGDIEEAICKHHVGLFGICIDDIGKGGRFRYMIAGPYAGGEIPEGLSLYEIPELEWVKFLCKGPLPGALQSVNTKIYNEWLPGNSEYEIAAGIDIEWYSEGNPQSLDYESAIWIPVKRK